MHFEPHVAMARPLGGVTEEFGHVVGDDIRLAYVHHRPVASRNVCVVILGPIGAERERAYRTIVELARSLAQRGYEVLRYDHRGIGESDGDFEDVTIGLWASDARRVVESVHAVFSSKRKTTFLGVRMGALIASELFADGFGDAAIFLGSGDGQALLRDASRRALVADSMHGNAARSVDNDSSANSPNRSVVGYSGISAGSEARVDGYLWRPRLVSEAAAHRFRKPDHGDVRPWLQVELRGLATNARKTLAYTGSASSGLAASGLAPSGLAAFGSVIGSDRNGDPRTSHAIALNAPKFWESSPQLVPENGELFDAIGAWCDQIGLEEQAR